MYGYKQNEKPTSTSGPQIVTGKDLKEQKNMQRFNILTYRDYSSCTKGLQRTLNAWGDCQRELCRPEWKVRVVKDYQVNNTQVKAHSQDAI